MFRNLSFLWFWMVGKAATGSLHGHAYRNQTSPIINLCGLSCENHCCSFKLFFMILVSSSHLLVSVDLTGSCLHLYSLYFASYEMIYKIGKRLITKIAHLVTDTNGPKQKSTGSIALPSQTGRKELRNTENIRGIEVIQFLYSAFLLTILTTDFDPSGRRF